MKQCNNETMQLLTLMQYSYLYLLLLCWSLPFVSHSQTGRSVNQSLDFVVERMLLHTDRQLYISGETIWFKVYTLDSQGNSLSRFSKAGYLELISQEGIAVSRVKVALEEGHASGTIKLPKALSSGSYTLRSYTQALRNSGEEAFAKQSLIILNPEQPIVRAKEDQPEGYRKFEPVQPSVAVPAGRYLNIVVETTQTTFLQRSMATLEITTKDVSGQAVAAQLSLSVALQTSMPIAKNGLFKKMDTNGSTEVYSSPKEITFPAESDGMHLSGKVVNQRINGGEPGATVFLAFPGKTALVYATETDEAGHFSFLLPKLFGLRQIVLQVRTKEAEPLVIELEDEFHEIKPTTFDAFVLPPDWLPLANAALVNAQIGQAYQAFELPPVYTTQNSFAGIPFFGQADAQYFLDDYTRFPLPEFFFEVATEVRVNGKFGEEELKVLNNWENVGEETPPLLMVDGVPVFDQKAFLKINNQLIASTEVVTAPFWLNSAIFDGIIQLSSFEGDARCYVLPKTALRGSYLTLLPPQQFAIPDYKVKPESRLPDFRNTLYWNPLIQTDAEGKATISFFTSDALGEYVIRVEGVSDQGLLGTGSKSMVVGKEVE